MEKGIPHGGPDEEVHHPQFRRRGSDAREGYVGRLGYWLRQGPDVTQVARFVCRGIERLATWQPKPPTMPGGEFTQRVQSTRRAPPDEVEEITGAPGEQAESRDAEERREDLAVDFNPDATWGVEVVAVVHPDAVALHEAHFRRGAADQEEEDHGAPCDYIQTVECDEDAKGRFKEGAISAKGNGQGLLPSVFRGEAVAVWIRSRGCEMDERGGCDSSLCFAEICSGVLLGGRMRGCLVL